MSNETSALIVHTGNSMQDERGLGAEPRPQLQLFGSILVEL